MALSRRLEEFYASSPEREQYRPTEPLQELGHGAMRYMHQQGLNRLNERVPDFHAVEVNPRIGRAIAQAYEHLPLYSHHPKVHESFAAMREETGKQFDLATRPASKGGLGIHVEVSEEDPYKHPGEMMSDLARGKLRVLSTHSTGGHPFFTNEQNDMFRAVHDMFGHAATGRFFDRHGEEAAWLSHSRMYSPGARPAMTGETRGQNSALNFGSTPGTFPEQKVALLPTRYHKVTGRRTTAFLGGSAR